MWESGFYPPGAEHDSNAPYNETDVKDIYEADASRQIDEEIDNHDESFIEWACDNDHLNEDFTDEDVERITKVKEIRDAYYRYRVDDVCNELAEDAADYEDYCRSEAYEAYRERCLLGED